MSTEQPITSSVVVSPLAHDLLIDTFLYVTPLKGSLFLDFAVFSYFHKLSCLIYQKDHASAVHPL